MFNPRRPSSVPPTQAHHSPRKSIQVAPTTAFGFTLPQASLSPSPSIKDLSINAEEDREFDRLLLDHETEKEKLGIVQEKWEPAVVEQANVDAEVNTDVCRDILTIPADDVAIRKTRREYRTEKPPIVSNILLRSILEMTELCQFRGEENSTIRENSAPTPPDYMQLHADRYEIDEVENIKQASVDALESSKSDLVDTETTAKKINHEVLSDQDADQPLTEFLPFKAGETSKLAAALRAENRVKLLSMSTSVDKEAEGTATTFVQEIPFYKPEPRKLKIEFKSCRLTTMLNEPFFGSVFLYDTRTKQRVSETFHIDLREPDAHALVYDTPSPPGPTEESRSTAIFNISQASEDLHLAIFIDKVTEGDPSDFIERFGMKTKLNHPDRIKSTLNRLRQYKQAVAYNLIALLDDKGSLSVEGQTHKGAQEFKLDSLFRCEADHTLEAEIEALLVPGTSKKIAGNNSRKGKQLGGSVHLRVTEIDPLDIIPNRISPSLEPLKPFLPDALIPPNAAYQVIKELQEFPERPRPIPFTELVNNLYIYPTSFNFSKGLSNMRNLICKVQLLDGDADVGEAAKPLKVFYGRDFGLQTHTYTCMAYHNRTPNFRDEIKVQLPLVLKATHHFLFTFSHISCKGSDAGKKGKKEVETEVAYAFARIFIHGKMRFTDISELPITNQLSPGYLEDAHSKIKWLDNQKGLFSVKFRLQSTIYTEDPHINNFITSVASSKAGEMSDIPIVTQLGTADPVSLANFGPVLLDQLFDLLFTSSLEDVRKAAFQAIAAIVSTISNDGLKQSSAMQSYVKSRFNNRKCWSLKPFSELLVQLLSYVKDQNSSNRDLFKFSWFFTRIISKSVILHLNTEGRLNSSIVKKEQHLDRVFITDLQILIEELAAEVLKRSTTGLVIARELCESLAYFFCDAFIFLDKSTVYQFIILFTKQISANTTETLIDLKFEFLNIICQHDHFIALNLPVRTAVDKFLAEVEAPNQVFSGQHLLLGVLLYEVTLSLHHKNEDIRMKGLKSLRRLLESQEIDHRFNPQNLPRICNLYLPFIKLFCDNIARLLPSGTTLIQEPKFTDPERYQIALCSLFILKHIEQSTLLKWIETQDFVTYAKVLKLLESSISALEYEGSVAISARKNAASGKGRETENTKRFLENMYRGGAGQTLRERRNMSRNLTLTAPEKGGTLKNRQTSNLNGTLGGQGEVVPLDSVQLVLYKGVIAAEASLISLDLFDLFLNFLKTMYDRNENIGPQKLQRLFSLMSVIFSTQNSERVLVSAFGAMKLFLYQFPSSIFREKTNNYCADMCRLVLKYTGSCMTSTRQYATASLYLIMRRNFEETRTNFGKSRVATTVALSKLEPTDDTYLRKSFATIKRFTMKDRTEPGFRTKVLDLADQLFGIVRDSVKMHAHKDDPEMLQEMTCRIAHGYKTAPDLRLTTLENLARQHQHESQNAEAAMCLIHSAALVAEYLFFKESGYGGPRGSQAFAKCTINCQEETIWTADVGLEEEGVCQSDAFSRPGLIRLLEAALPLLTKGQLHETTNELYKLLIPMYEEEKAYLKLARAHAQLSTAFNEIWSSIQNGKRILGTYFRVGFYGAKFEALDGKEYVYKERTITQLSEICQRLSGIYSKKYAGEFQLLQDSNKIERSKLDPNKAYIQVTFLEPYFTNEELSKRVTYFDKMNNISRFFFLTPFTKTGKAHGDVASQWMRRIVLSTEKPFPYVKKRLLITNRDEIEMSPLEVSLEAIESRCAKLRLAIEAQQPEPKQIQMLLQGSVRLQVNAGPLEIANVFLSPASAYQFDNKLIESLKRSFVEFVRLCGAGLTLNRSLIKEDQINYQNDLEEGYEDMKRKLGVYLPDLHGIAIRKVTGLDTVLSFIANPQNRDQVTVDVARFLAS